MGGVSFCLQARPVDGESWLALSRRVEALGFTALYVPDHPGSAPSPFVALAAAASVTSRLGLGSYVANAGLRDPIDLAADVATLDMASGGRAILGLGAGHTPQEWAAVGRVRPSPSARVARLGEVVEVVRRLLDGEEVTFTGEHVRCDGARLVVPRPVQESIPLLIGGSNPRLLELAGARADVVGLTGLGRTLPDGHRHEVRWSRSELVRARDLVMAGAEANARPAPIMEALVQDVAVTDDPAGAAEKLAAEVPGLAADDVLGAPFVLIGRIDAIAEELLRHRDELGISRFVVREQAIDTAAALMERLG